MTAKLAPPITKVTKLVSPSRAARLANCSSVVSPSDFKPSTLGSCAPMITSANPCMNPTITGFDRKSATKPSRSTPASRQSTPVITPSPAASSAIRPGSPSASGATATATIAAIAVSGPTTSWRELPNSA